MKVESSINDNQYSSLLIKVHYVRGTEIRKGRIKVVVKVVGNRL